MTTFEKLEDLIYKGFKETDRKFQETDRKFRETDRILKESSRETERILKESSRETELEIQKVNQKVGEISDSLGRFAESMVAPAVLSLFNQRGIPIKGSFQRIRSRERRIEFDVVAFNTEYVVVVSVKMTLRVTDVEHFLNKRLPIFKELFPQYKDMKVVGAVAGAVILGESDRYAMKRGLYVLAQSGENITLLNDEAFEAKIF
ncbi:MAG: DUF3782 domain-containing protein [bacterium]|nr:DUF3782 domain-containing protein [bacterium]